MPKEKIKIDGTEVVVKFVSEKSKKEFSKETNIYLKNKKHS